MVTTCDNNNPLSSATDANSLPQGWWCAARQRLWCRCEGGFASKLVGCRHLYGAEPWLFLGRPPTQTPSYHVLSIHVNSFFEMNMHNLLVWCFFSIFWDVYGCVPHILGLFSICVWTSCVSQRSTVVLRTRTWETDNHVFAKLPIQGAIYCLWDKPGHPTGNLWRKHRKTIENIGKT
jgi:hypothetical protein